MSDRRQAYVDRLVAEVLGGPDTVAVRGDPLVLPAGWHRGLCVDVHDLGDVETRYGTQHQVELTFELETRKPTGARWLVWRRFTATLTGVSTLRQFLEVWQGYPFTAEELTEGVSLVQRYLRRSGMFLVEPSKVHRLGGWLIAGRPLPPYAADVAPDGVYIRRCHRKQGTKKVIDMVSDGA